MKNKLREMFIKKYDFKRRYVITVIDIEVMLRFHEFIFNGILCFGSHRDCFSSVGRTDLIISHRTDTNFPRNPF